jgi:hypothetical protein
VADPKKSYGNLPHAQTPGVFGALKDAVESVQRFAKVRTQPIQPAHRGKAYETIISEAERGRQHNTDNE